MARSYITTATTTQVLSGDCPEVVVQVNADLTGTITMIDGTAGSTADVAIITNPTAGDTFIYRDFLNGVRVVTSATCDVTVSASPGNRY